MRTYPYRDTDGALVCIDTDAGTVLLLNDGGEPTGQTRVPTEDEQALIDGQRMEDDLAPIRAAANAAAEQARIRVEALEVSLTRALVTLRTFVAMPPVEQPAYYATNYPDVRTTMAAYLATPMVERTEKARELYGLVSGIVLEITLTMAMGQ